MMTMHAGKERTESQWLALLSRADSTVKSLCVSDSGGECIVEAELAQSDSL